MQKEVCHLLLNYLASYPSLVLAGIGRFSRQYRPAHFVGNQLKAPGSTIYFEVDKSLQNNDLTLTKLFKANALDEASSMTALQLVFEEVNKELSQQSSFRYTGLGTFIRQGAFIGFQPDQEQYKDAFGYGLESVLVQASAETPTQQSIKSIEPIQKEKKQPTSSFWLKVAAAVLFLMVANISVLYLLEKNTNLLQQSDLGIYDSIAPTSALEFEPPVTVSIDEKEKVSVDTISAPKVELKNESPPTSIKTSTAAVGNQLIIVGAFRDMKNADKYIEDLKAKGYTDATLAGTTSTGLHRVAVAKFSNQEMAEAYLEEIKSKLQADAWLMN